MRREDVSLKREKFEIMMEISKLKRMNIDHSKEVEAWKEEKECLRGDINVLAVDVEELKNDLKKKKIDIEALNFEKIIEDNIGIFLTSCCNC